MATVADTASVLVLAESDERCHLAASMQPPTDDMQNLIIFYYMSGGFNANRRSSSDRGMQHNKAK